YRVRAADGAGNVSAYSPIAAATTSAAPDTQAPTAPATLTATAASSSQINLGWATSTDDVGVAGYQVGGSAGGTCTNFLQVGPPLVIGTSFNNVGLDPATSYRYRVRAADAAGNVSGYSEVASATTLSPPPQPAGLVAAYGFNEGSGTTVTDSSGNNNAGTIGGA